MPGEPTIEQGHIDAALTDYAIQKFYYANNFIANIIAPPVAVPNRSDKFFVVDPREGLTDEHEEELMYGQESTELNFVVDKGQYSCTLYGKRHLAPDGVVQNADPAVRDMMKGDNYLINNMRIRRERNLWRLMTDSSNYVGGGPGTHWFTAAGAWDAAGVDPKVDIDQAALAVERTCGAPPNTLLLPPTSFNILTSNSEVRDLIKYQRGDLYLRTGGIGDVVFNLRVIRAAALYDANAPLEASNIAFVWDDNNCKAGSDWAWVGYVDPNPGLWTAGWASTFVWNMNNAAPGMMGRMRVYRDEPREGEWHDFRTDYDLQITNNRSGCMIVDIGTGLT
jgi:hypothetical protein